MQTYAENQLIAECAGEAGYEVDVPWRDLTESTRPGHLNPVGRRLLTEDLAQAHGYGRAESDVQVSTDEEIFQDQVYAIDDATWERCLEQARDELGVTLNAAYLTQGLAAQAADTAANDDAVKDAQARWYECMLKLGLPDLPGDPSQMPPESFGFASDGATGDIATPREIEVATQDFACRVSSGYRDAFYEAEWNAQVELLRDSQNDLARVRSDLEANRDRINAALGLTPDSES